MANGPLLSVGAEAKHGSNAMEVDEAMADLLNAQEEHEFRRKKNLSILDGLAAIQQASDCESDEDIESEGLKQSFLGVCRKSTLNCSCL